MPLPTIRLVAALLASGTLSLRRDLVGIWFWISGIAELELSTDVLCLLRNSGEEKWQLCWNIFRVVFVFCPLFPLYLAVLFSCFHALTVLT